MIKIEGISKQFKEGINMRKVRALEGLTLPLFAFFDIDTSVKINLTYKHIYIIL